MHSWFRTALLALLAGSAWADKGDFMLGGGVEADNADGMAVTAFSDVAVTDDTRLSGAIARSDVDLSLREGFETLYGSLDVDHHFDPVGIRVGYVYWGDSDVLDSRGGRASVYWRRDRFSLSGNYEYRDFEFDIPAFGQFPGRTVDFDADGLGLNLFVGLGESMDLSLGGMSYDYSVNLSIDQDRGIAQLVSVSRLSLINSLVDHSAYLSLGLDDDLRRWELELSTRQGAVTGDRADAITLRFLMPLGDSSDIEFGLGRDDSDLYGDATLFSVFVYFYGT